MTPTKEITKILAEAMGWTISQKWPNYWINPAGETVTEGLFNTFDPLQSDADFWSAMDKILGDDYRIGFTKYYDGTFGAFLSVKTWWFDEVNHKTRLEAGCVALVTYIKEKE